MYFIVRDKAWLGRSLNVSDKTLHVVVGMALYFVFLRYLKSPIKAALAVLVVELINEINDTIVAYPYLTRAFWTDTATDILATMALPCLFTCWLMLKRRGRIC